MIALDRLRKLSSYLILVNSQYCWGSKSNECHLRVSMCGLSQKDGRTTMFQNGHYLLCWVVIIRWNANIYVIFAYTIEWTELCKCGVKLNYVNNDDNNLVKQCKCPTNWWTELMLLFVCDSLLNSHNYPTTTDNDDDDANSIISLR